jgi:hypothetical protein
VGNTLVCAIYLVDGPGLEVRAHYAIDDFARTARVANVDAARELAEQWRRLALSSGFRELAADA